MFNSRMEPGDRFARAFGRIAFGTVLIVGTGILVQRLLTMPNNAQAAKIIGATWLVALFCGWSVRQAAIVFCEHADVKDIFTLSYAVPVFGLALLLPLSIHVVAALALGCVASFDAWARVSIYLAGAAHVGFAILATLRAVQLARGQIAISARTVFTRTLAVSAIPFVVPSLVVGFTGLFLLPLLDRMEPIIERERDEHTLPVAVVV